MKTIRPATSEDLERVLEINQSHVPKVSQVSIDWMKKYLEQSWYFHVIETETQDTQKGGKNQIAGFLIAMLPDTDYQSVNFLWFKERYDSFVYIDRVAIEAQFAGQGLGKKLYAHLESQMKTQGVSPNLTCEVNIKPPNHASLEFHRKLSFQEVGQQDTGPLRVSMLLKRCHAPFCQGGESS